MKCFALSCCACREQQVLISPCGGVARQAFSADATYLIAACVNGVCVWPLPDNEAEFKTNKRLEHFSNS